MATTEKHWLVSQFYKYTQVTTFHGFQNFRQGRIVNNVFWTLIIMAGSGIAIYQTYGGLKNFIEQPTATSAYIVDMPLVQIPDIVICHQSKLNVSKLKAMGMTEEFATELVYLAFEAPSSALLDEIIGSNRTKIFEEYREFKRNNNNVSFDRLLMNARLDCEEIILMCRPAGLDEWYNATACCASATAILTQIGPCYRVNSPGSQMWPGKADGWLALLDTSHKLDDSPSAVQIQLAHPGVASNDESYDFSGDAEANLQITHVKYRYANSSKSTCIGTAGYSATDCRNAAWAITIWKICGCLIFYVGYPDNRFNLKQMPQYEQLKEAPICDPFEWQICLMHYDNDSILAEYSADLIEKNCKHSCEEFEYNGETNTAALSSVIVDRLKTIFPTSKYLLLTVFYPDLQYEYIQEYDAYSWQTIVSNIGGTWGLWVGCSILTFIHGALAIAKCAVIGCGRNGKRVAERSNGLMKSVSVTLYGNPSEKF